VELRESKEKRRKSGSKFVMNSGPHSAPHLTCSRWGGVVERLPYREQPERINRTLNGGRADPNHIWNGAGAAKTKMPGCDGGDK